MLRSEKTFARGDAGAAALGADRDLLAGEIVDALHVAAREEVELLGIEPRDIGDRFDAGEELLLARLIERVGLDDGEIETLQRLQIDHVLQRAVADHGHDAARRAVIEQGRDIGRDLAGDAVGAAGLELDDAVRAAVEALIGGKRGRQWAATTAATASETGTGAMRMPNA